MRTYNLTHLSDEALVRDLTAYVARDRVVTAGLLARLAEVDARRLYVPAGYPSMHAYCLGELRFSDDAAFKRIQVARAARQYPQIFEAIADGQLHLTAVRYLAPYLTAENATEMLAAAAHRNTAQIEELIARRFGRPMPELPNGVTALLPSPNPTLEAAPGSAGAPDGAAATEGTADGAAATDQQVSRPVETPAASASEASPTARNFRVEFTLSGEEHDMLQYAQSLLGHTAASGDVSKLFVRGLRALIVELEKRKFGAARRPRRVATKPRRPGGVRTRHIPSHVKHAVWQRDGGRCTFLTEGGKRCPARKMLEFDHIEPFARGGEHTVAGLRLRCRTHNQFEAERAFGSDFMKEKRAEARRARAQASGRALQPDAARPADGAAEYMRDVYSALRALGFRSEAAKHGAEHAGQMESGTLEERIMAAIRLVGRKPNYVKPQMIPVELDETPRAVERGAKIESGAPRAVERGAHIESGELVAASAP